MKIKSISIIMLASALSLFSQEFLKNDVVHDVYLFGNLIDSDNPNLFYTALKKDLDQNSNQFTIILDGDIIGHDIELTSQVDQLADIFQLIELIGKYSNGKLVIIPGDRDWRNGQEDGYAYVKNLEKSLKSFAKKQKIKNFHWPLKNGCPGPFDINLDEHLQLVTLNSQWWNHRYDKPDPADANCKYSTVQDIKEELGDLIEENENKNILIVAHHPIKSLGNSGGRYSLSDNLKPFPILGTFRTSFRSNIGGDTDMANDRLSSYINLMENEIYTHHNLIVASSHEKNQQIMKIDNNYLINSGAIDNPEYAASDFTSIYSKKESGIMKLSYSKLGEVKVAFLNFNKKDKILEQKYKKQLFNSACNIYANSDPSETNLLVVPCELHNKDDLKDMIDDMSREVNMSASKDYKKNWFGKLWMGKHYRKDWGHPIRTTYLNIDTSFHGIHAIKKGGGRQTKSLRFKSENGDLYTFRSVDKDPTKALDFKLRETIVDKVFKDQTSAQQPYGALVVSELLDHVDLLHAHPKLYVMPNVKALGPFQQTYGDMLGLLEEHPSKKNLNGDYFANADDILKSNQLFKKMYDDKSNIINKEEFIRARLFDILVGDWSKHEDNWKWAGYKKNGKTIYRPIPRDRDMVFSKYDGILPSIADLPFGMPNTESFDHKIKGFKSLVYQARYMDRFVSTEADKSVYIQQAKYLQDNISDSDIEQAVRKLPKESFEISGKEIISKLKQRKKDLLSYAEKYYKWLNSEVELLGSVDEDYFQIESLPQGKVRIAIFDEKNRQKGIHQYYERIFDPKETKELRIYGLGDKDIFDFINLYQSNLTLRLFGGSGKDSYRNLKKSYPVKVYDLDLVVNRDSSEHINIVDHWDKNLYDYDRNRLKFNSWLPSFIVGYNTFNGFTTNIGNTWTKQRWDKQDYASKHSVKLNFSSKGDVGMSYNGRWHNAVKKWDVLLDMTIANPEYFNSFYGLGNDTSIDNNLELNDFYVANFNQYTLTFGIARKFWKKSEFSLKSGVGIYNSSPTSGSIFFDPSIGNKLSKGTISTIPTVAKLDIDLRDHSILPNRGVRAVMFVSNYNKLNDGNNNYGSVGGSLEYYLSNHSLKRLSLGLKLAGTKGYGNIPYYHQASLGGNTGLRGYTSNRFTGRSMIYFNSEVRLELFGNEHASIPWKLGLIGFYDTGRVFIEDNPEGNIRGFRSGYGGGFYIIPFSKSITISFTLGWSAEETLYPGFTFGTSLK